MFAMLIKINRMTAILTAGVLMFGGCGKAVETEEVQEETKQVEEIQEEDPETGDTVSLTDKPMLLINLYDDILYYVLQDTPNMVFYSLGLYWIVWVTVGHI